MACAAPLSQPDHSAAQDKKQAIAYTVGDSPSEPSEPPLVLACVDTNTLEARIGDRRIGLAAENCSSNHSVMYELPPWRVIETGTAQCSDSVCA